MNAKSPQRWFPSLIWKDAMDGVGLFNDVTALFGGGYGTRIGTVEEFVCWYESRSWNKNRRWHIVTHSLLYWFLVVHVFVLVQTSRYYLTWIFIWYPLTIISLMSSDCMIGRLCLNHLDFFSLFLPPSSPLTRCSRSINDVKLAMKTMTNNTCISNLSTPFFHQ